MAMRLQLIAGMDVLEEWAETATQAERNHVYEALFAVGDGSAFLVYDIFGDPRDPGNFVIIVKPGLMLKIMVQPSDCSFVVRRVGVLESEPQAPASAEPTNPE
jgi:hypothetical protein